jgi:hypothetical protein
MCEERAGGREGGGEGGRDGKTTMLRRWVLVIDFLGDV